MYPQLYSPSSFCAPFSANVSALSGGGHRKKMSTFSLSRQSIPELIRSLEPILLRPINDPSRDGNIRQRRYLGTDGNGHARMYGRENRPGTPMQIPMAWRGSAPHSCCRFMKSAIPTRQRKRGLFPTANHSGAETSSDRCAPLCESGAKSHGICSKAYRDSKKCEKTLKYRTSPAAQEHSRTSRSRGACSRSSFFRHLPENAFWFKLPSMHAI